MSVLFVVRTNTLEQTNIDRSEGCLRYGVSLRYIWCQNNYNTDLFLSIHQIIYSQAILMLVFILGWQNYKFFNLLFLFFVIYFIYCMYTMYYEFDLVLYFCTFDTFVPAYKTLYFISYIKNGKAEYQTQFIFVWYFAFTCDVHGNSTKRN